MTKKRKFPVVNGGMEERVRLLLGTERLEDLATRTKLSYYVIGKIIFDGIWTKNIDKFIFDKWLQEEDAAEVARWLLRNYCSLSEKVYWPKIEREHKD